MVTDFRAGRPESSALHVEEELLKISRKAQRLLALCVVVASSGAAAAERAAGIEYEFVARPAGIPAEYEAPVDTRLRFLAITAIDGSRVGCGAVAAWRAAGGRHAAGPHRAR